MRIVVPTRRRRRAQRRRHCTHGLSQVPAALRSLGALTGPHRWIIPFHRQFGGSWDDTSVSLNYSDCFIFIIFTIVSLLHLLSTRETMFLIVVARAHASGRTSSTNCHPSASYVQSINSAHDIPCSGASSVMVHVYALPPEFEKEITSE